MVNLVHVAPEFELVLKYDLQEKKKSRMKGKEHEFLTNIMLSTHLIPDNLFDKIREEMRKEYNTEKKS